MEYFEYYLTFCVLVANTYLIRRLYQQHQNFLISIKTAEFFEKEYSMRLKKLEKLTNSLKGFGIAASQTSKSFAEFSKSFAEFSNVFQQNPSTFSENICSKNPD